MRLILNLRLLPICKFISPNYNYALSAAIYKLLRFGSPEFAEFLHNIGYINEGKTYKLFSFALRFDQFRINKQRIHLLKPTASLIISSPLIEDFIQNFVVGTFEEQKIEIYGDGTKTVFEIEQVESLPNPTFKDSINFTLLSPLVLSTKKESNGKLIPKYFRYYDNINEISRIFNQNLINKYKLVCNKECTGEHLKFNWDTDYIDKRINQNKKLTKLISIKKANEPPLYIKANNIPFILEGNKELIKVGYECGFGQNNSLGFGLASIK